MPTLWKGIIIVIVILYMVVNESERIETRKELDRQISINKQWATVYFDHTHYYNGKPKP